MKISWRKVIDKNRAPRLCRVETCCENAFRERSLISLPLRHQRKLKQYSLVNAKKPRKRVLGTSKNWGGNHIMNCTFCKMKPKSCIRKKNKAKKLRKLLMKDWKMMKMMLAMKMKTLDNSNERKVIKTVCSICNRLYRDQVHEERKLANMQYLRRIYLPSSCAKKYWFWTRFLLPKLHPVKWTCN